MTQASSDLTKRLRDTEAALSASKRQLASSNNSRKKIALSALVAGVILAVAGGQFFPGYQLDSTATRASEAAAYAATNEVLAHLCAERFLGDEALAERFALLETQRSEYEQHTYLREGPWGIDLSGQQVPNSVANACLGLIHKSMDDSEKTS